MELLYLWFDNFRNIKEQGFDFSSEITFKIKSLETKDYIKRIVLALSLNKDHVNLFPKGVVNVTGIVGANASGKSNLLDGLKLLSGRPADITSGLFFCVLNHKTNTIETWYYKRGGANNAQSLEVFVEIDNDIKKKYKIKRPVGYTINKNTKPFYKITEFINDNPPVSPACFISNTFDSRNETLYTNIHNLSTNLRFETFLKSYIEQRPKKRTTELYKSHASEYHKKELRTLLSFIASAKENRTGQLPEIPRSLVITFNFNELEYIIDNFGKSSPLFTVKELQLVQKNAMDAIIQENDPKTKLYNLIVLCSFYYALRWDLFKPNRYEPKRIETEISQFAKLKNGSELFAKILKFLSPLTLNKMDQKSNNLNYLLGSKMRAAIKKVTIIPEELIENPLRFRVEIEEQLWSFLNLVFSFRYVEPSSFMDYQWENLSSGQEAFFLQFGRLNEIKGDIDADMFWLLIDEGDLYFHPQWQKDYIKQLLQFITLIFPRKQVQVFITSHSPFIASDLPRSNLIFLERDAMNECKVTDIATHKLTFGANIHMLYTDSFFMDSVIGSFAREKIDAFINWALDKKSPNDTDGNYRKFIKLIGEPILSAKLLEMYANKMKENYELSQLQELKLKIDNRISQIKGDV